MVLEGEVLLKHEFLASATQQGVACIVDVSLCHPL